MTAGRAGRASLAALVAATTLAALVVACSPTPAPTASPAPVHPDASTGASPGTTAATVTLGATFDPAATAPSPPFDGLYVSDLVSVSGDATVAVVRSGFRCIALEHLIGAGEWAVVARRTQTIGTGPDASTITILALQDGDATALAWLSGGDACTARLARTTTAALRLSGAATFDGQAALDQPFCVASGKSVAFDVVYRTPGGPNVNVSIKVPVRIGLARLDPDEVTVQIAPGAMSPAQLAGTLIDAYKSAESTAFPQAFAPTDASRLTLDVRSVNPFAGTLHLTGLEGGAGAISLDGDVACHLPGGSLDRAAAAAAATPAPAASGPAGTPGPTLAPIPGLAAGTAVVTGGPIAGTYRLPASSLDCHYDPDAGAWTVETLGGADPTFYLHAFMGSAGGSTERASMGLVVGDGANDHLLLVDSSVAPADGVVAQASVAIAGSAVTIVAQGHVPNGRTLSVNLSCAGT
ncbi:MAG TPA: hypothetical protein VE011_04400 [Candidatus Dormibacteraeota bacterium]|nr:hypothetical protein [Candidatus Dormibacteraeota bacterium]